MSTNLTTVEWLTIAVIALVFFVMIVYIIKKIFGLDKVASRQLATMKLLAELLKKQGVSHDTVDNIINESEFKG